MPTLPIPGSGHPSGGMVPPLPPHTWPPLATDTPGIWSHCYIPSTGNWEYIYILAVRPAGPGETPNHPGFPIPTPVAEDAPEPRAAGVDQPLSDRPPAP
jgi:hypothetical protein